MSFVGKGIEVMLAYGCPHTDDATTRACVHLIAEPGSDYVRRFTGHDLEYDLICGQCRKQEEEIESNLRLICTQCFERIETEGFWDAVLGRPAIRERAQQAHFEHMDVVARLPTGATLHDIQPLNSLSEPIFIALTTLGEDVSLLTIDLAARTITPLVTLPSSNLQLDRLLMLTLSPNGHFAAIASTRGEHGLVVDLQSGQMAMRLARGSYWEEASDFPIAFFQDNDHTLLVHGTDWSRLDISDPLSGALLTSRDLAPDESGKYPERAL